MPTRLSKASPLYWRLDLTTLFKCGGPLPPVYREEKELRIYAGNLSYQTTEQDLRRAFEPHGEVKEVTMIQDRDTGRSKGFAFVEMPASEEAAAAIAALNGTEISDRTITVNEAKPRAERSFGGGGGGYGNRGGGGGGGGYGNRGGGGGSQSPRW